MRRLYNSLHTAEFGEGTELHGHLQTSKVTGRAVRDDTGNRNAPCTGPTVLPPDRCGRLPSSSAVCPHHPRPVCPQRWCLCAEGYKQVSRTSNLWSCRGVFYPQLTAEPVLARILNLPRSSQRVVLQILEKLHSTLYPQSMCHSTRGTIRKECWSTIDANLHRFELSFRRTRDDWYLRVFQHPKLRRRRLTALKRHRSPNLSPAQLVPAQSCRLLPSCRGLVAPYDSSCCCFAPTSATWPSTGYCIRCRQESNADFATCHHTCGRCRRCRDRGVMDKVAVVPNCSCSKAGQQNICLDTRYKCCCWCLPYLGWWISDDGCSCCGRGGPEVSLRSETRLGNGLAQRADRKEPATFAAMCKINCPVPERSASWVGVNRPATPVQTSPAAKTTEEAVGASASPSCATLFDDSTRSDECGSRPSLETRHIAATPCPSSAVRPPALEPADGQPPVTCQGVYRSSPQSQSQTGRYSWSSKSEAHRAEAVRVTENPSSSPKFTRVVDGSSGGQPSFPEGPTVGSFTRTTATGTGLKQSAASSGESAANRIDLKRGNRLRSSLSSDDPRVQTTLFNSQQSLISKLNTPPRKIGPHPGQVGVGGLSIEGQPVPRRASKTLNSYQRPPGLPSEASPVSDLKVQRTWGELDSRKQLRVNGCGAAMCPVEATGQSVQRLCHVNDVASLATAVASEVEPAAAAGIVRVAPQAALESPAAKNLSTLPVRATPDTTPPTASIQENFLNSLSQPGGLLEKTIPQHTEPLFPPPLEESPPPPLPPRMERKHPYFANVEKVKQVLQELNPDFQGSPDQLLEALESHLAGRPVCFNVAEQIPTAADNAQVVTDDLNNTATAGQPITISARRKLDRRFANVCHLHTHDLVIESGNLGSCVGDFRPTEQTHSANTESNKVACEKGSPAQTINALEHLPKAMEPAGGNSQDSLLPQQQQPQRRIVPVILVYQSPPVAILTDFFLEFECNFILKLAADNHWPFHGDDRVARLPHQSCSLLAQLISRAAGAAHVRAEQVEDMFLVRYLPGESSIAHVDGPRRRSTLLVYLDSMSPGEGGETDFPELGFQIRPQRGMAVLWHNVVTKTISENNENIGGAEQVEPRMLHGSLPATRMKQVVVFFVKSPSTRDNGAIVQ